MIIENLFFVLGIIGAACCVSMFWAIERGRVDGNSMLYYVVNGIGGMLIFVSVIYDYDGGDMGSLVVEGAWVIISLLGIVRLLREKGKAA